MSPMTRNPNNTIVKSKANTPNTFNMHLILVVNHNITKIFILFQLLRVTYIMQTWTKATKFRTQPL